MDWFSASQGVLAIATLVKIVVALLRMAVDAPRWAPPAVGAGAGIAFGLLFLVANGTPLGVQSGAQAVLQGLLGTGIALGIVEQLETRAVEIMIRRRSF